MSFASLACLSGIFAATASLFAKLFTDTRTEYVSSVLQQLLVPASMNDKVPVGDVVRMDDLCMRVTGGICFGLIFASNAAMWSTFTKALAKSESSVKVSTINNATNFFVTAILGNLLFNEPLTLRWWCGASLIVLGTLLVSQRQGQKDKQKTE
ncbi:hypothetical protein BZG36_01029 [Bifiguratus adelaidae]|uniref:EamA domain-containing protein n=1 Tax=Bifiguratus adelaidae TaxID=1938954 RepID=A0A261Y6E5_9FUNG|nr:hypothetical protein BZG36_01029 [Bifiguratus adelaidae]